MMIMMMMMMMMISLIRLKTHHQGTMPYSSTNGGKVRLHVTLHRFGKPVNCGPPDWESPSLPHDMPDIQWIYSIPGPTQVEF